MRKVHWISVIVVLLGMAVWGFERCQDPTVWTIQHVQMEGPFQKVAKKQLQARLAPVLSTNLFLVPLEEVRALLKQDPWVLSVTFKKQWFSRTLVIVLKEQKPMAYWNDEALLNDKGEVFRPPVESFPEGLPTFYGEDAQAHLVFAYAEEMAPLLKPLGLQIRSLSVSPRRAWQLSLQNGLLIFLGRADPMAHFRTFLSLYRTAIEPRVQDMVSVNMNYTNGMAVLWKNV